MYFLGSLIYFAIWIPCKMAGHTWWGMLAGTIGCVAWWMGLWWWEFGTVAFWKKI